LQFYCQDRAYRIFCNVVAWLQEKNGRGKTGKGREKGKGKRREEKKGQAGTTQYLKLLFLTFDKSICTLNCRPEEA